MAEGEDVKSPVQPNLTKMRDDECIPIARELLRRIANSEELIIGSQESYSNEEAHKYYESLYVDKIAPLLVEKDVKIRDLTYIFQMMHQAIQLLQDKAQNTVDHRYDQAVAKLMGVADEGDVRIHNIQDVLVENQEDAK